MKKKTINKRNPIAKVVKFIKSTVVPNKKVKKKEALIDELEQWFDEGGNGHEDNEG